MLKLLRKKTLSEELKLEEKLSDIKNILYANTNAATSQMRTFIEAICKAILIYEGVELKIGMKLIDLINEIDNRKIFSEETIKLFTFYRVVGNDTTHKFIYPTREEVSVYYNQLEKIYEEFQLKYEMEYRKYRKQLFKSYSEVYEHDIESSEKEYLLLNGERVIVPKRSLFENSLDSYYARKIELNFQLEYLEKVHKELNFENKNIKITKDKLNNNTFNVVVLGEVNRGKSTLINGLLGKNILPSNILPTTSVITKIVYGEEVKAEIKFNNGIVKNISVDNLKDYVTTLQKDGIEGINTTTVYYPNEICKNNCVLIDTPGVNDVDYRNTEVTYNYIPYSDAIIFLIDPDQVFTNSEKIFLKSRIFTHNLNKIFFVLNKSDNINEEGIKNLKKYIQSTLKELELPYSKFYVVSSKEALIGKMKEEDNKYVGEFKVFEKDIKDFLFFEKGNQIIKNTIGRTLSILEECINKIYHINSCFDLKREELLKIEKELLSSNNKILKEEKNIFEYVDKDYDILKNKIIDVIYIEMNKSFDNLIENLRNEEFISKEKINELEGFINKSINNWINMRINPILVTELNRINTQLINMIYEKTKRKFSLAGGQKDNYTSLIVFNSEDIETCYTPRIQDSDEITFIGVGALITALLSGSLLGGIVVAALGYIFLSSEESIINNNDIIKEKLIRNINIKREIIIENVKKEIIGKINKDYLNNKEYVKKEITVSINSNIKLIKDVNEKLKRNRGEKETFKNELDLILKNLIIMYKQNKNYIREVDLLHDEQ